MNPLHYKTATAPSVDSLVCNVEAGHQHMANATPHSEARLFDRPAEHHTDPHRRTEVERGLASNVVLPPKGCATALKCVVGAKEHIRCQRMFIPVRLKVNPPAEYRLIAGSCRENR